MVLWHESADLEGVSGILIPGGFAYGDYLRAGVIARFSPVMRAVEDFAVRGGPVLGICNGFQVLAEAGLVPGALLRNRGLRFVSKQVDAAARSGSTRRSPASSRTRRPLRMPVAHGEGCYFADDATLDRLEREGAVLWRYANADGSVAGPEDAGNPNGSLRGIAGVHNAAGNVAGLMPHPETRRRGDPRLRRRAGDHPLARRLGREWARDGRISLALPRDAANVVPVGQAVA